MKSMEQIFDICLAIIAGIFVGVVLALSISMALVKSIPELFKK